MALHNSGIRARCYVSIRQSPSLCNAILNTSPCLLAIWSWRTNMFLPSSGKDFNCRGHLIVKKWQQKQMYFYVSLNRFNMMRVNFTGQSLHQCIIGNRNMHMFVLFSQQLLSSHSLTYSKNHLFTPKILTLLGLRPGFWRGCTRSQVNGSRYGITRSFFHGRGSFSAIHNPFGKS